MQPQNFLTRRNIIILISALVVFVLFIASVSINSSNNKKSARQPQGEEQLVDDPAVIAKGENLYAEIGALRYEALRKDLTKYAREQVKSTDKEVSYEIGKVNKKDDTVTFSASYSGTPGHKINVTLTMRKYDRQKLSFISSNTKAGEFDGKLESNSARNKYIATLPVSADLYTIDFEPKSETIVVYLGEHSLAARNAADAALKTALGEGYMTGVSYLAPGLGGTN